MSLNPSLSFNNPKLLTKSDLLNLFEELNSELSLDGVKGELCIVGGAVMCLVFSSRVSTQDVDGIFEPKSLIYNSAKKVAVKNNLPIDWLNDSVKGFLSSDSEFSIYKSFSNLTIKVASPEYMLAMKVLSSRTDNDNDRNDIKFLLQYLNIENYEQVELIILKYYPPRLFQTKCKYFVMELLEEILNV